MARRERYDVCVWRGEEDEEYSLAVAHENGAVASHHLGGVPAEPPLPFEARPPQHLLPKGCEAQHGRWLAKQLGRRRDLSVVDDVDGAPPQTLHRDGLDQRGVRAHPQSLVLRERGRDLCDVQHRLKLRVVLPVERQERPSVVARRVVDLDDAV